AEVVACADVDHTAVAVYRLFERVGHQPAERSGLAIRPCARIVGADVEIQRTEFPGCVHSEQVDGAQVCGRREAHDYRCANRISGQWIVGQHHQAVETVGDVEGVSEGGLHQGLLGGPQIHVGSQ